MSAATALGLDLAAPPGALEAPRGATAAVLDTPVNRALCWGIGSLLGILTLTTEYVGTPTDLWARVAPVDMACLCLLTILFFRHRMNRIPWPALLYAGGVVLSIVPGLLVTTGAERHVWTGASALLMAFGFYMAGLNIGESPALLRALLFGLCVGVFAETIIVVHDAILPNQWFPDPMEFRVRGTFKANGQLGAYGFCAAGFLLTFGVTMGSAAFRRVCLVLGITAACFVFVASRRTGMGSVFLWAGMFLFLARGFSNRAFYKAFAGAFVILLLTLAALWPQIEQSFVGRRFMSAMSSLGRDEGFIQDQFKSIVNTSDRWFPFGFGVGRGDHIDKQSGHEVHNQILAVMVELGILGLAGWLGTIAIPLIRRKWQRRSRSHELLGVLLTGFLLVSLVFMCHNTLARDRTYLLFLGIATIVVTRESRLGARSALFPETDPR